ncbi:MAG TPA: hypothetical protein VGR12_01385 [Solirubrobacteraceae bacterium]|nr:hypothetical protein [Solirubrobacteraceae bacterium]
MVVGCGGEDAPTREEFARSANAICADLERQGEALGETKVTSPDEVTAFTERARQTTREAVERIRELEVPEGADGEVARAWQDEIASQAEDELIPALDRVERAAKEGDKQELLAAAQELEAVESARAERLAADLGADRCAE